MTITFGADSGQPVLVPGGKRTALYQLTNVFGDVRIKQDGPQVFLVHQLPHGYTPPHYHEVDQFQIFTRGSGTFGRKSVATTTMHYADAYTTYGPILTDAESIDYFTARLTADCGSHYMPESRKHKTRKSGRHFVVPLDERSCRNSDFVTLIPPHDDGLAAYLARVGAGDSVELPSLTGTGRLLAVLNGSLNSGGRTHHAWAWAFCGSHPGDVECAAGGAGATVLCLDYPVRDAS